MALVAKIDRIEVTVTSSETEALLLGTVSLKSYIRRTIRFPKDDKSYPYFSPAKINIQDCFSSRRAKESGRYFGPFPSAYSVRDSLNILQKVFKVRQCEDSFSRIAVGLAYSIRLSVVQAPAADSLARRNTQRMSKMLVSFSRVKAVS